MATIDNLSASQPVAIVAGAGSGIGRGCALRLAGMGWQVILIGRTIERLQETAHMIAASGGMAIAFPADIRDWDRLGELQAVLGDLPVGLLINSAGGQFGVPAEEMTRNGWQAVVDLNLSGAFYLSRQLFPALKAGRAGIVHVVANAWQRGAPTIAHSAAARAGTVNLCQTLAVEWAKHGIRINAVSPGMTLTEAVLKYGVFDREVAAVPLKRAGTVDEVVDAILFMAQAQYITGEVLTIDGGQQLVGFSRDVYEG